MLADGGVEAVTRRKTKSHKKRLENGLAARTLTGWWQRVTDRLMHQTAFNGRLWCGSEGRLGQKQRERGEENEMRDIRECV